MGRNRKSGKRIGSRLSRAIKDIVARGHVAPADHILARRKLWSFVTPSKGPDGRGGEIDQDICDGIGQLHAIGLLDGHGIDPQELRDKGRLYANLYWKRYSATAPKMGTFERADKSTSAYDGETAADRLFEKMDGVLSGYDRACVVDLVIDPMWPGLTSGLTLPLLRIGPCDPHERPITLWWVWLVWGVVLALPVLTPR